MLNLFLADIDAFDLIILKIINEMKVFDEMKYVALLIPLVI